MGCSLVWTDVPEPYDDENTLRNCALVRTAELDIPPDAPSCPRKAAPSAPPAPASASPVAAETPRKQSGVSHVFIEGDNYPVLRLLGAEYEGRADVIYIDPPYNTGKRLYTYSDARFLRGDRHSAWLSFMSRRLTAARRLLSESGCIFISIGQEELYRLKLLCDGIFGEDNFVNDFMWLHGKGKKDRWSRTMQQSNLCYAKDKSRLPPFRDWEETAWARRNADGDRRGNWFSAGISFDERRSNARHPYFYTVTSPSGRKWTRQWLISRSEMDGLISEDKIYWGKAPDFANVPRRKVFDGERTEIIPKNIIDGAESTRRAQAHVDRMLGEAGAFDNPKPVPLIRRLLAVTGAPKDALIIDFFAGSGTTLEAAVRQNEADGGRRRCVLVQKAEQIRKSGSRYGDIAELCRERLRRAVCGTGDSVLCYRLSEEPRGRSAPALTR